MEESRDERFRALVERVGEPLRRYALRRLPPDAADDALAEAFVVLWRRLDDVPADAELPWSYGVIRNCVANEQRGGRRRANLLARLAGERASEAVAAPELPDRGLVEALGRLRPADGEVLRLWAWEDLSPAEIAVTLGITPNAASIRLHRAKRRLAGLLGVAEGGAGKDGARPGHEQVEGGRAP